MSGFKKFVKEIIGWSRLRFSSRADVRVIDARLVFQTGPDRAHNPNQDKKKP